METTSRLDLRALQKPTKQAYRKDAVAAAFTLRARGLQNDSPLSCSVDLGRAIYEAGAHKGVGGSGSGACSGDLLLGALAACAQITCQMVAHGLQIPIQKIEVQTEGDLDLRGTLGVSQDARVAFKDIRLAFDIVAPAASEQQLRILRGKTEQYCVVYQTLLKPPIIDPSWHVASPSAASATQEAR